MTITPEEEPPIELEDVPAEESISTADAAERIDEDPQEQRNFTDPRTDHSQRRGGGQDHEK